MFIRLLGLLSVFGTEVNSQTEFPEIPFACQQGFKVQGLCLGYCPTGFLVNGTDCIIRLMPVLDLDFSSQSSLPELKQLPFSTLVESPAEYFQNFLTENGLAILGSTSILNKLKISLSPVFTLELSVLPLCSGTILSDSSGNLKVWAIQTLSRRLLFIKAFNKTTALSVGFEWIHLVINIKFKEKSMELKITINGSIQTQEYHVEKPYEMHKITLIAGGNSFVGLLANLKVLNFETAGNREFLQTFENLQSNKCLTCSGSDCFVKCCQIRNQATHRKLSVTIDNFTIIRDTCPIFYTKSGSNCIPSLKKAIIISFDSINSQISDGYDVYKLVPSVDPPLYGINRGRYFNGVTNYFTLTATTVEYFYLVSCFSFWIKPDHLANPALFSGNNFEISISSSATNFSVNKAQNLQSLELNPNQWFFISLLTRNYSGNYKTIAMTYNNNLKKNSTETILANPSLGLDGPFYVGKGTRNFKGWMYLFLASIDNEIRNKLPLFNNPCSVQDYFNHPCPENHELGYFLNKTTNNIELCGSARLNCRSSNDCNICADPACLICSSGKYFNCSQCTDSIYKGYCFKECPLTTFTFSGKYCVANNEIRSINFNNGISNNHSSLNLKYEASPNLKYIISRGTYFPENSFAESSTTFEMFPELTQLIWIKVLETGFVTIGFHNGLYYDEIYSFMFSQKSFVHKDGNLSLNDTWAVILKKSVEFDLNRDYPFVNQARIYSHIVQINGNYREFLFYDNSTSISRYRMSFRIAADASAGFLLYYYSYFALNNFNPITTSNTIYVIQSISSVPLSGCGIREFINAAGCTNCGCIGCLSATTCSNCPDNCFSCTRNNLTQCTACNQGYSLLNGLCINGCPLLYANINGVCNINTGDLQYIEWDFNQPSMNLTNNSVTMKPSIDSSFQYRRGWYTKQINVIGSFIISPTFQLVAWVKLPENLQFLTRNSSLGTELNISTTISRLYISVLTYRYLASDSINIYYINSWKMLKLSVYNIDTIFLIKFEIDLSSYIISGTGQATTDINFFRTSSTTSTTLGDSSSSFWIYRLGLIQNYDEGFDLFYNFISTPTWNCSLNLYSVGSSCLSCKPECTTCRFSTNCSYCVNPLCRNCERDYDLICNSCTANAVLNQNSICACLSGYYQNNNECIRCPDNLCTECSASNPNNCITCVINTDLSTSGLCSCKSGYYKNADQCSRCQNPVCNECSGPGGSFCIKCMDKYYASSGQCLACAIQCLTCSGNRYIDCISCLVTLNDLCTDACPNYFQTMKNTSGYFVCNPITQNGFILVLNRLDNPFATNDPQLTFTYKENNTNVKPKIAYARGILMNQYSVLTSALSNFKFSNKFTFQLIINPIKKSKLLILNRFVLEFDENFVALIGTKFNIQNRPINLNSWLLITIVYGATASNGILSIYLNTQLLGSLDTYHFLDITSPIVIQSSNSDYYVGWIYGIAYRATNIVDSSQLSISSDIQLWTCPYDQLSIDGQCTPCPAGCPTCRYTDTCFLCSSPNCADCYTFNSTCLTCISGPALPPPDCSCTAGYARNSTVCNKCHNSCTLCTNITHLGCTTCILTLNGKCTTICPLFYTNSDSMCLAGTEQKFVVDFNNIISTDLKIFTNSTVSFNIIQVSTGAPLSGVRSLSTINSKPILGYKRGLYVDKFYLESRPFVLSNIMSFQIWFYPYNSGVLFSKNKLAVLISETNITIRIVPESRAEFVITKTKSCLNSWNLITLALNIEGSNLKLTLKFNELSYYSMTPGSFLDNEGKLLISDEKVLIKSWIYSFVYSLSSSENNEKYDTLKNYLWPCLPNTYYEKNSCQPCMASCDTCRYGDSCSLCSYALCDLCDTFDTMTCNSCSPEAIYTESGCRCEEGKANVGSKCLPCHNACATCNNTFYSSCIKCNITLNNFCTSSCPLFYINQSNNCVANGKTSAFITFERLDGMFNTDNPGLSFTTTAVQPQMIGYLRGLYFNASQLDSPDSSMFSNVFSISIWFNARSHGRILEKKTVLIDTSDNKLSVTLTLTNSTFYRSMPNSISSNVWSLVFLSVESKKSQPLRIIIRQNSFQVESNAEDFYFDQPSVFSLGSGMIGWVYNFQYWSESVDISLMKNYFELGSYLWNCQPFNYFNGRSCSPCPNSCNCRRPTDCRPCNDMFCEVCNTTQTNICLNCTANSVWVQESSRCAPCSPRYVECSYNLESDNKCREPFMKNYDKACMVYYGEGDLLINGVCVHQDLRIFSFTFNRLTNFFTDGKYQMYMGLDDNFWPKYDNFDPYLLYKRGLYFNRSVATLGTSQKPYNLQLSNGHSFGIHFMLLGQGLILSLSDQKSSFITLSFQISPLGSFLILDYSITDTFSISSLNYSSPIETGRWYHFSWSLEFKKNTLRLRTYLDNQEIQVKAAINSVFNQPVPSLFFMGSRRTNSFAGFVYRINLFNFANQIFDPLVPCTASGCPEIKDFVWTCLPNQYLDQQLFCKQCQVECLTGCSGPVNCNLHPDPLCKTFDYLNETCIQCVDGSINNTLPCVCAEGAAYIMANHTCRCPGIQKVYNNKCDNCTRWLQPGEVTGYFDSSFMQVVFNFLIPVIKVPCNVLFDQVLITKLGTGFVCIFAENSTVLTIVLGKGNSLKEETISFVDKTLIGARQECGFNSTLVNVTLKFSAQFPSPKAIIKVADTVFFKCQEMVVDGSLSTGKLLNNLFYKWEFVLNGKEMPELSKEGVSVYTIPSKSLEAGTILVTLTVKNRFDYQDSTTSKVTLSTENAIKVMFDQVNENSCKQSVPCQFSVKSIDSCIRNPSYNYSWILKNEKSFTADFNRFWDYQTIPNAVKIPPNFFLPGILKFELTVTEMNSDAESVTPLNIKILPSDLVISTDRTGGFVSSLDDLTINSSVLNSLPQTAKVQYDWECFLLEQPCKFQFISDKPPVTIPRSYLQSRSLDRLVLTVTLNYLIDKESSEVLSTSASVSLNFKIVSWEVMKVQIVEALTETAKRVFKKSEKLTFKAIYEDTQDVYTFFWEVEGKDSLVFITPTNQRYVGIDPTDLVQGSSYRLILTLISESGSSSKYFYEFTMNSPPKFGVFSVTPESGVELQTEFYFLTNDWRDAEKNYPLQYIFGYIYNNSYFYLTLASTSNYVKLKLSYIGETLTLFTRVFDSLGDFSELTSDIKVKKIEETGTSEFLSKAINSLEETTFDELPNLLSNILAVCVNREIYTNKDFTEPDSETVQYMQELTSIVQDKISSLMEKSIPSSDLIDLSGSLLQTITLNPHLRSEENLNKTTQMINQLLNSTSELGLSKDQAGKLLGSVDNSIKMKLTALYNQTTSMDSLHQVLNTLNAGMLKQMIPGQVNQLETSQMAVQSAVLSTSEQGTSLKTSDLASVVIPSELFEQMSGKSKIGIYFSTVKLDSEDETQSVPDALSISVFQDKASQSEAINLKSSFFTFEVPVMRVEKINKTACVYLNSSNLWDSTGCSVVEKKSQSIVCKCNHLSFFSAGEGTVGGGFFPSNNFDQTIDFNSVKNLNATSALGFYVCGALLIAYVTIAIIVGMKDAEDMKEVIRQIDEQNVMKVVENNNESLHNSQNDDAIMVDSVIAEGEMLEPKKQENVIVKAKVRIKNLITNHKFLKIFFLFDPNAFRLSTCTMIFTVLIGKMYFIGLFYDGGGGEQATTIREAITSYTFRDFLVMFYSTVIMFCIELVIAYLTKNNPINVKWSKDENKRIIRNNRWRRIGCLALCWPLMIWFSWSIAMFAMNLDIGVSYKWIITTITGYIGDIFFMPGFEYLLMKWIFPNIGLILQLRFCFYKCAEKKKKKTVENESVDEYASQSEGTDKPGLR